MFRNSLLRLMPRSHLGVSASLKHLPIGRASSLRRIIPFSSLASGDTFSRAPSKSSSTGSFRSFGTRSVLDGLLPLAPELSKENKNVFGKGVTSHICEAAECLQLKPNVVAKMKTAEAEVSVVFPVEMDDGTSRLVTGQRIIHSTVLGPGKGGIRIAPDLTEDSVRALAAEMPIKSGIHGLPLGGAKGGIDVDPASLSDGELARVMRGYVRAVLDERYTNHGKVAFGLDSDVPAPDVGSSPPTVNLMDICVDETLRWISDNNIHRTAGVAVPLKRLQEVPASGSALATPMIEEYLCLFREGKISDLALLGCFTGKSIAKGGSEGRVQATGLGVAFATLEYLKTQGTIPAGVNSLDGQSVAIHGFGNVGQGAAKSFGELGASVKAIAEFDGKEYAVYFKDGISAQQQSEMQRYKIEKGTLRGFPGAEVFDMDAFWRLDVDLLVPAARENVITKEVAEEIRAKLVIEGANGPTTPEADEALTARGIAVLPDVFANAAGVMVSYFEMEQNRLGETWSEEEVRQKMHSLIETQTARIVKSSQGHNLRMGAFKVGLATIAKGTQSGDRAAG